MASVNVAATHKFVVVLNEKSHLGKLLSATGQLAMSLYENATPEQRMEMAFVPFLNSEGSRLITVSNCSFIILKGTKNQLITLYNSARGKKILSAIFTSTMSFNGIGEDLIVKTATTPLEEAEPYGVGLFGLIEQLTPLTKKFSMFK